MHNLLSHLIHLTVITEFEILFYIYYIIPYERQSINNMFDVKLALPPVNASLAQYIGCASEQQRLDSYNDKLIAICYYYIGAINAFLLGAFVYDLYKVCKPEAIPRVLSSPKAWISIEMVSVQEPEPTFVSNVDESILKKYWTKSRFVAKMCETLQLIILLGIFEYLFFNYIFNKFKIVSAKLIVCNIENN